MVLAEYYNVVRLGREGYDYIIGIMEKNARTWPSSSSRGRLRTDRPRRRAAAAGRLPVVDGKSYDEFDVAWQLSAERGWMVPAYTLPPDAKDVKVMRALVKETLSGRSRPPGPRHEGCLRDTREEGRADESERRQVKTGTGY